MRLETVVRVLTAPVYIPVCVGMWVFFYLTDMQGATDQIARTMQQFSERNHRA